MACGCDKVHECMHTIVAEAWVPTDPRFLRQNVIILTLNERENLVKHVLVVNAVTKAGRVDNCQANAQPLRFHLCVTM